MIIFFVYFLVQKLAVNIGFRPNQIKKLKKFAVTFYLLSKYFYF